MHTAASRVMIRFGSQSTPGSEAIAASEPECPTSPPPDWQLATAWSRSERTGGEDVCWAVPGGVFEALVVIGRSPSTLKPLFTEYRVLHDSIFPSEHPEPTSQTTIPATNGLIILKAVSRLPPSSKPERSRHQVFVRTLYCARKPKYSPHWMR